MADTVAFKTPRCSLEWVNIRGEGKENLSGKMQYVANAVIDADDPLHEQIKAFWEEHKPKGFKKPPKSTGIYEHKVPTDETDEDGKRIYEPDGKFYLAFKTGTTYADSKPKVVDIYNAKGKKVAVPDDFKIGNGSEGIVSGAMGIYVNKAKNGNVVDAGVTLYLNAIQLIKLEEYTQDAGFDEVDDEDAWGSSWEGGDDAETDSTPSTGPRL